MVIAQPHDLAFTTHAGHLDVAATAACGVAARVEVGARVSAVEAGGPLVHPGVAPLVGPHDHREPHMRQLVSRHTVERRVRRLRPVVRPDQRHHRVLHPSLLDAAALDRGHVRPRVGEARPLG